MCAVAQNVENTYLVSVTCNGILGNTHSSSIIMKDTEQHLAFPLVLQFVSVSELSPPPVVIHPEISIEEYELQRAPQHR